ncbi:MAG: formate dehydrogenase accessory sulfurtransferase FdhD [Myxococcales bacterium]|nr:formate dehydrogenase accessory sulfurtransferase FdhD [Myxococcales bacterium]
MGEDSARAVSERAAALIDGDGVARSLAVAVAVEQPLQILLAGEPFAVTMRTPGQDRELVAGLLLAEGLIGGVADLGGLSHCGRPGEAGFGHTMEVKPGPGFSFDLEERAPIRRGTLTASSCGVCGRERIDDLLSRMGPLAPGAPLSLAVLRASTATLEAHQPGFAKSGGLHGAAVLDCDGRMLTAREDVGRHNAVDKAIGALLLAGRLPPGERQQGEQPAVLVISGRISFEIVQKALAAGLRAVCGISAPSSLAIDLAQEAGLTLAAFVREGRLSLFTDVERVSEP